MISSFLFSLIISNVLASAPFDFQKKLLLFPQKTTQDVAQPIRKSPVKYSLVQRWNEEMSPGNFQEKEQKICEGDALAPVVFLKGEDTIANSDWVNVECETQTKPLDSAQGSAKVIIRMNFFVIFMESDIFLAPVITKNFVAFVGPDALRAPTVGFVSFPDLHQKSVDVPVESYAKLTDKFQADLSIYTASVRYVDDGPAPTVLLNR